MMKKSRFLKDDRLEGTVAVFVGGFAKARWSGPASHPGWTTSCDLATLGNTRTRLCPWRYSHLNLKQRLHVCHSAASA